MRITLHQLAVFRTVAELGSVTQAAQKLHMTQPAVSNILKQLEQYYDCQLTEVISRKIHLTDYGKVILDLSLAVNRELDHYQSQIQLLKGRVIGELKVAIASTAQYFMPHMLAEFKGENPNIHIKMKVFNREMVLDRLHHNRDDFVILSQLPPALAVDSYPIYADQLVVVASPKHRFANHPDTLPLQALETTPWIIREPGSGTRMAMLACFKQEKFSPSIEMELGNNEAIKQAIAANLGVSIVSKRSISLELEQKQVVILPVQGFPLAHIWHLIKRRGKSLSPIAEICLQHLVLSE